MPKSKVATAKPGKSDETLKAVKNGAVTKSSQTAKVKSGKIAKETAKKVDLKKIKKADTSDEEDSDSDSSVSSGSESDDSDSDDSGSSSEKQSKKTKTNGITKSNGVAKKAKDDSSDSDSDESESSNDEKPVAADAVESDDGDSDSDSEENAKPTKKAAIAKASISKAVSDDSDDSDSGDEDASSDDSDDSDDSADSEEEEEEEKPKKRKAEAPASNESKKQRTGESASENPNASKNLFVGSLSWNVDDEWLGREFASFGEIVRAKVMTDRNTGRSKGFGYVEFTNLEDAVKAHKEMTGAQLDGREINVDFSQPRPDNGNNADRRARNFNDQLSDPTSVLFVGNIAFSANEQIIGDAFGQYGSVNSVRLPTDPESGNLKGFGYVEFGSVDEAKAALEAMNGAPIEGRPLRLDFSAPRQNSGGSPRGGGGRGGPRGGGRGGFGGRGGGGGRGAPRGGRGGFSTNRGGFGDFKGKKMTF